MHTRRVFQLQVLTGARRGATLRAEQLPLVVGRGSAAHLRFEDAGVWDHHLEFSEPDGRGVHARVIEPALCSLNDEPFAAGRLRNGDTLKLGSLTLRFWLAEATQSDPAPRERVVWFALVLLTIAQFALLAWLAR